MKPSPSLSRATIIAALNREGLTDETGCVYPEANAHKIAGVMLKVLASERRRVKRTSRSGNVCRLRPAKPLHWFSVPCRITCEGETLEEGTVYARAATWGAAEDLAIRHVHETWGCADQRLDYLVKNEHPEQVEDETEPCFNRPDSVFTNDRRTHLGV